MSTTDSGATFEFRTELDRLYQLLRWRAMSQAHEDPSRASWVPSEEAIAEQRKRTEKSAEAVFASGVDPGELYAVAAHGTTSGYAAEFLGQLSISCDDVVCVRGATEEIRRTVVSELFAILPLDPVTVPVSSVVGPPDGSALRSNGGTKLSSDGHQSTDSPPEQGSTDPADAAATIIARLVDADSGPRHPLIDFADVTQISPSVLWELELVELVLSEMNDTGLGGVFHLPAGDTHRDREFAPEALASYTIDLRSTDAGTEARVLGADAESLSENWWLLCEE